MPVCSLPFTPRFPTLPRSLGHVVTYVVLVTFCTTLPYLLFSPRLIPLFVVRWLISFTTFTVYLRSGLVSCVLLVPFTFTLLYVCYVYVHTAFTFADFVVTGVVAVAVAGCTLRYRFPVYFRCYRSAVTFPTLLLIALIYVVALFYVVRCSLPLFRSALYRVVTLRLRSCCCRCSPLHAFVYCTVVSPFVRYYRLLRSVGGLRFCSVDLHLRYVVPFCCWLITCRFTVCHFAVLIYVLHSVHVSWVAVGLRSIYRLRSGRVAFVGSFFGYVRDYTVYMPRSAICYVRVRFTFGWLLRIAFVRFTVLDLRLFPLFSRYVTFVHR